jgi:hypothetical protein
MRSFLMCSMAAALLLGIACAAMADPLPGRDVLKFDQQPMIATPIPAPAGIVPYYGHDELSTAVWNVDPVELPAYNGVFMADDFADHFDRDVVHVRWWGSYMNTQGTAGAGRVTKFLIAFENDVPASDTSDPYDFSHPDCQGPKFAQISTLDGDGVLMPKEGTFTEKLVLGSNPNEPVYEYNAELCCPFPEKAETVYWLKIVALVDHLPNDPLPPLQWGWHNRDYTIKDVLASTPPLVNPGEHQQGAIDPGTPNDPTDDIPIWHFQDDAVGGTIQGIQETGPCQVHMDQDHWVSTNPSLFAAHYVDDLDGPIGIGQYSKDLAFQLFTVPEPGTLTLLFLGALLLLARRVRK